MNVYTIVCEPDSCGHRAAITSDDPQKAVKSFLLNATHEDETEEELKVRKVTVTVFDRHWETSK